jgi:hypothetical protein
MGLQVRMNVKKRTVELRVSTARLLSASVCSSWWLALTCVVLPAV